MAKVYQLRAGLPNGVMFDGYTCYTLARTVQKLVEVTGRPWSYQVIHRALKAVGVWAEAFRDPAVPGPDGAAHVARPVVVSIEAVETGVYYERLHDPNEQPPVCERCQAPRLRAADGWHSCSGCGPKPVA